MTVLDHHHHHPTVNNMANPIMWITYHDAQAYPAYLIEFKTARLNAELMI